jgi:hypothetical protein
LNKYFFIVGAQRSGTTYLYYILAQHPEIEMATPVKPEPKFFLDDNLYLKGIQYYKERFFFQNDSSILRGEKSTSYMESEKAACRIAKNFPSSKIIFIVRNPIHRAISNYNFSVENGFESEPIEFAFYNEQQRTYNDDKVSVSPYSYLKRGLYAKEVSTYLQYFPRNQLKILIFEDFINNLKKIKELYQFLEVNVNFIPQNMDMVVNASNKSIQHLPKHLINYLKEYYNESNKILENNFSLDLSSWKF